MSLPKFILFIIVEIFFLSSLALADELDANDKEALKKTIELLKSSEKRLKAANETEEGRKAHKFALDLTESPKNLQSLYSLATVIFARITKESNGDAEKMTQLFEEALKNPESFAKQFTPEEIGLLKELSKKIENQGKSIPSQ